MTVAITREVSPSFAACQLTHLERAPIDVALAMLQHRRYEESLVALGCDLLRLPAEPAFPDAVFVEDTAIVLDELAVITRPGAESRRGETDTIVPALRPFRPLGRLGAPVTLDGGDVLRIGRTLFVGLSSRTSPEAVSALESLVAPFGYRAVGVPLTGCLHLKSAITEVADNTVLVNPRWVDVTRLGRLETVEVDPAEPYAANALKIGRTVVYPDAHQRTRRRLERVGVEVHPVDVSELAKAEGGVTCCSLVFEATASGARVASER